MIKFAQSNNSGARLFLLLIRKLWFLTLEDILLFLFLPLLPEWLLVDFSADVWFLLSVVDDVLTGLDAWVVGIEVLTGLDAWVVGIDVLSAGLDVWVVGARLWDGLAFVTAVVPLTDAWVVDAGVLPFVDAFVVGTVEVIFSDDWFVDKDVLLFSVSFIVGGEGELASPCALEEKTYISLDSENDLFSGAFPEKSWGRIWQE